MTPESSVVAVIASSAGERGVRGAEGVVPRRLDALLDALEAAPLVMQDTRHFTVHDLPSVATAKLDKFK